MSKIQNIIIADIIALIEEGKELPWEKPWNAAASAPQNMVWQKPYRGINRFMCGIACLESASGRSARSPIPALSASHPTLLSVFAMRLGGWEARVTDASSSARAHRRTAAARAFARG